MIIQSGNEAGAIKFKATSKGLLDGSTDIITVSPGNSTMISDKYSNSNSAPLSLKPTGKILGADISFLPQLEAKGIKFSDNGKEKDATEILKDHGFNYIRLACLLILLTIAATRRMQVFVIWIIHCKWRSASKSPD